MIVLTRHQDNVEAINSTLRNAGHAVRCSWIRELNDLGDALSQINAHMLIAPEGTPPRMTSASMASDPMVRAGSHGDTAFAVGAGVRRAARRWSSRSRRTS